MRITSKLFEIKFKRFWSIKGLIKNHAVIQIPDFPAQSFFFSYLNF